MRKLIAIAALCGLAIGNPAFGQLGGPGASAPQFNGGPIANPIIAPVGSSTMTSFQSVLNAKTGIYFPTVNQIALCANGVCMTLNGGGAVVFPNLTAGVLGLFSNASGQVVNITTKFTATGCSLSATVGSGNVGRFTSGTTGTCTAVITINGATGLAAPNGWNCWASDRTTPADVIIQTADSTTTATISGTTVSGDIISFGCQPY